LDEREQFGAANRCYNPAKIMLRGRISTFLLLLMLWVAPVATAAGKPPLEDRID